MFLNKSNRNNKCFESCSKKFIKNSSNRFLVVKFKAYVSFIVKNIVLIFGILKTLWLEEIFSSEEMKNKQTVLKIKYTFCNKVLKFVRSNF